MFDPTRIYGCRYLTEPWNKPIPEESVQRESVIPGVTVSKDNYGYADHVILVSILDTDPPDPDRENWLILSSRAGGMPFHKELVELREYVDHCLKHGHYTDDPE